MASVANSLLLTTSGYNTVDSRPSVKCCLRFVVCSSKKPEEMFLSDPFDIRSNRVTVELPKEFTLARATVWDSKNNNSIATVDFPENGHHFFLGKCKKEDFFGKDREGAKQIVCEPGKWTKSDITKYDTENDPLNLNPLYNKMIRRQVPSLK